jgi:hypothetical protein
MVTQVVMKFQTFFGTQISILVFTTVRKGERMKGNEEVRTRFAHEEHKVLYQNSEEKTPFTNIRHGLKN